jgi:ribonucleoside-diphosphate reductase alpha chain
MRENLKILSDVTVFTKYAMHVNEENRRETWEELVTRNCDMHIRKYPFLREEITQVYHDFVFPKKVLPSMRSLQFGGKPIELHPNRIYNCGYLPVDDWRAFSETMFLLLGGTGVGYSVQRHHVRKLPSIRKPTKRKRWVISDDIMGWAEAVKALVRSYLNGKTLPVFDFRDIREKDAPLITTGGKAPGAQPLKECLFKMRTLFESKENGQKLTTLECHDLMCFIADAVLSGGIRRAAMIAGFDMDDESMITSKGNYQVDLLGSNKVNGSWEVRVSLKQKSKDYSIFISDEDHDKLKETGTLPWWYFEPQRARANNSGVFVRHKASKEDFLEYWKKIEKSGSGEPGIYWTNNAEWFSNPCCEIALRPFQFCNLTEINAGTIQNQLDLIMRCKAAAFIGTLQVGYTDFHYLRDIWQETTERDALLGVSMTGIAGLDTTKFNFRKAAQAVKSENKRLAKIIDVRPAARTTCVKPGGSTSLVFGTSSGIHAWLFKRYIRRQKVGKNEAIYKYFQAALPKLIEDDQFAPNRDAFIMIPVEAPEGSVVASEETAHEFLSRIYKMSEDWVKCGHIKGDNSHNISATVYIKKGEWDEVGESLWENRKLYNGLAVLPYDNNTYIQAPHEEISKERYDELMKYIQGIDLSRVTEYKDETRRADEIACAGGACNI